MTQLTENNDLDIVQDDKKTGNQLFPVFLKLNNLHTVLIGAGNVGLEKLTALLNNSPEARVTVIAENIIPEVYTLTNNYPKVTIKQKSFTDNDLDSADIVVAATDYSELNAYIRNSAHQRKLLINVADKPDLCDFYLGSIVQKGDLKIGISTNGKSPTVAKRLKEVLNESLPPELDITLQQMNDLRNTLSGDFAFKVKALNEATAVLVEPIPTPKRNLRWVIFGTIVFSLIIAVTALWYNDAEFRTYAQEINPAFYYFFGAGFIFALIDGAIGMSYGVTSTSFSIAMGLPPATASMGVHLSEITSNGIAGWMHYRLRNVNWKLYKMLVIPGIIGAVSGAYILSSLEEYSTYTKPFISLYTLILGGVILSKAFKIQRKKSADKFKNVRPLGFIGGFIDAVFGGGWGSIVLSTLIAGGRHPRFSLGAVKLSRFFIAITSSLTFITMTNGVHWEAVMGLVIGSALASPIAAKISSKLSVKAIMVAVGIIVMLTSLRTIVITLMKIL
ncbi:MAG: siroheme synthase [Sphingobacteriaceae bacterium]|nr:MAG: siroheme synthase [Sphingobacteriaceae bacterium]